VTQRIIEVVIGRLITDEAFRASFLNAPQQTLAYLVERGMHLTDSEIAALVATDSELWDHVADHVDPRLQKSDLSS
jgi:hypothetical protein